MVERGEEAAALPRGVARGLAVAEDMRRAGRIVAAVMVLSGVLAGAGLDAHRLAA